MRAQSFKDVLAASGPDQTRSPMLSREQRLAQSMPAVVVEMLEQRRLMTLTIDTEGGVLTVTGTSGQDAISVSVNSSYDNSLYIVEGGTTTYGPYSTTGYIKILAGGGNDAIYVDRAGSDSVSNAFQTYGEGGDDYIEGSEQNDTLYGGDGLDRLYGYGGADHFYGDADADSLYGGDGNDQQTGGAGNDVLYGENDHDALWGELGADLNYGAEGNDTVYAGPGNDTLYGGNGNDCLRGEDDDDFIYGDAGTDSMWGDAGNDWFSALDSNRETIDGGTGTDSISDRFDNGPIFFDCLIAIEV